MFCTNCGAANQDGARFCVNCAQSLSEVQIERRLSRPKGRKMDSLQVLFDFSFHRSVNPGTMKLIYTLSIFFAGVMAIFLIMAGFKISNWFGIFSLLILAPLLFLIVVVSSRVILQTILIIFRIADHTANMGATNIGLTAAEEKPEPRDSIQWNV